MTICCLGDLVLDVIVRLEQPLATGADATSRIVLRPGGQAANVAAWIAALGGRSRFVGKRGADDAGALAAARLLDLGVELVGPVEPEGNGVIVSLVHPSGERTMCADRGVATELRPEEIEPRPGSRTARISTSRATRSCASPSASPPTARSSTPARPAAGSASTSRPGARFATSAPSGSARTSRSSRPTSSSRTRRRIAIVGGPIDEQPRGSSSAAPAGRVVRRRTSARPSRSAPSSTRPAQATPSPPAGSSAGPDLALEAGARCVSGPGRCPPGEPRS